MRLIDMPCPCSSAILLLVASGIGGLLVRLPWALARAIPALTRSPVSALSNWARLAIMPNTSSPCGVVVSNGLLVADERHPARLEPAERVDQRARGAREAVVAPDQHDIELALAPPRAAAEPATDPL